MSIARVCDICGAVAKGSSHWPADWLHVMVREPYMDERFETEACSWDCFLRWAGDRVADELRGRKPKVTLTGGAGQPPASETCNHAWERDEDDHRHCTKCHADDNEYWRLRRLAASTFHISWTPPDLTERLAREGGGMSREWREARYLVRPAGMPQPQRRPVSIIGTPDVFWPRTPGRCFESHPFYDHDWQNEGRVTRQREPARITYTMGEFGPGYTRYQPQPPYIATAQRCRRCLSYREMPATIEAMRRAVRGEEASP